MKDIDINCIFYFFLLQAKDVHVDQANKKLVLEHKKWKLYYYLLYLLLQFHYLLGTVAAIRFKSKTLRCCVFYTFLL